MGSVAESLFSYLRDVIYNPRKAVLDIEKLPEDFRDFGKGLQFFSECIMEGNELAQALSRGDLTGKLPSRGNELAAPLKSLHSSLRHLTWQTQQIAKGDYMHRVEFMGDFSRAFNTMVDQLAERQRMLEDKIDQAQKQKASLEVHAYHDSITKLYNRTFGMLTLDTWLHEKRRFVLVFVDLDGLKYVNDEFGHGEGDMYILNAAKHLRLFSSTTVACRIGGDEFMLLVPDTDYDSANASMLGIYDNLQGDEYLRDKPYKYSMSFGLVAVGQDNEMSASDILSIADERMYENKRMRKKARKAEREARA